MKVQEHDGFIDVCCDMNGMNEMQIEEQLREILPEKGYKITDDPPGRVGNPGPGTIFRFKTTDKKINKKYSTMEE